MVKLNLDQLSAEKRAILKRRAKALGQTVDELALELLERELGRSSAAAAWSDLSMWLLQRQSVAARNVCLNELEGERRKAAIHLAIRAGLDPEEVFDEAYEELCYDAGLSPETVHSLMETSI